GTGGRRPGLPQTAETGASAGPRRAQRAAWIRRSSGPGCGAKPTLDSRSPGVSGRLGAVRTPRTCRSGRLARIRSARPTLRRTARCSARRCSSRSPARATARSARTAHPSTQTATTTSGPRGMRCTSLRCSTGSSRTCAASSATTSSTSPPSSPKKRLAPHVHIAIRSTVSRAELRQIIAANYHQVWWPSTDTVRFDGDRLPVWHEPSGRYLDPETGELLTAWDDALDAIGPRDDPMHVARFGAKFDAQGVLAGSKDSGRCIGYLTK